jgi:hypothetical protein
MRLLQSIGFWVTWCGWHKKVDCSDCLSCQVRSCCFTDGSKVYQVLSNQTNIVCKTNAIAIYQRGLFRRDADDRQGAFADLQRAASLFQQARDTVNYQKAIYAIQRLLSSPPTLPPNLPPSQPILYNN